MLPPVGPHRALQMCHEVGITWYLYYLGLALVTLETYRPLDHALESALASKVARSGLHKITEMSITGA